MAPYPLASRAVRFLALAQLALLLATNTRFGLHGDELYGLACAAHLDWGYVDLGPLVPWLLAATTTLFGDSTFAVRLPAALAATCLVFLSARLARQLGGNRTAQSLTALSVVVAPGLLRAGSMMHTPVLELLAWTAGVLILVSLLQGAPARIWLLFGLVVGIGLLITPTMLLFGAGSLMGLLFTRHRQLLKTPWPWLGSVVAAALCLPYLTWQHAHGWPTLEYVTSIVDDVPYELPPVDRLVAQLVWVHPLNVPLCLAAVWACLVSRRTLLVPVGWIWLICLGASLLTHTMSYLLPIYPALLAAGAVNLQPWLDRGAWRRRFSHAALALGGIAFAPLAVPLLPLEQIERHARAMTFGAMENSSVVTEDLRRMHGWEEMVDAIAEAHDALTPDERARCVIWAPSRSEAAAVDYYGRKRGLPPAVSGHMNYFLWGPPTPDKNVVIACGGNPDDLVGLFGLVAEGPVAVSENATWRTKIIWICQGPQFTWRTLWPQRAKRY